MELVLFLIAAGILFYLYKTFQTYLSNPIVPNDTDVLITQTHANAQNEVILSPKDKLKNTEYGIITRILGKLSYADGNSCALEKKLVDGIIRDMSKDSDIPESLYMEIYNESKNENIEELSELFNNETIGQYKKRLKVIEFMFALAYSDGNFSKEEEDLIIETAAILEIENDDFNKLYDEFAELNADSQKITKQEALNIFELDDNYTKDGLDKKYSELVNNKRQNILDPKNLTKSFNENGGNELRKISQAYILLLSELNEKNNG